MFLKVSSSVLSARRLVRVGVRLGHRGRLARDEKPERGLSGSVAADRDALGGGGVTSGEAGLVEAELGRRVVGHLRVETAAVGAENFLDAFGGAPSDVVDLGAAGCGQGVEDEWGVVAVVVTLALAFAFLRVHAVQSENVEMDVEPQSRVRPLNRGDRARVRIGNAAKPELALGSVTHRAAELRDESGDDLGAQAPIVAEQGAQAPGQ